MKKSTIVHKPAGEGCLECHDAHASDRANLLGSPVRKLCFSCHEDVQMTVESAETPHGALAEIGECMNCHDAHASGHKHLLRAVTRSLCLECHDRDIQTPGGIIPDMTRILDTGNKLHGPFTINDCAVCHQIHGGTRPRLLKEAFPSSFYLAFREESYELCFSCHDPSLATAAQTDRLTGFRDGERNLHFVHVNREARGRTCQACHEIHAGDSEMHIRDTIVFGDWSIPIGFSKTATGGSCSPGCHGTYAYDRRDPAGINKYPWNPPEPQSEEEERRQ
jgi:predicted CXXCH cytochrome family protein